MKKIEDFVAREMKYAWGKYKTIIILSFVLGPFLIQILFKVLNQISENLHLGLEFYFPSDWLGFWGSYLGVIPSGLIAALVAGYQIKAANKQNDEARKQDLIIMRNTKIIDYLYEIKNSISKSKLVLDKDKMNVSVSMLYDYLMSNDYQIFEELNWVVLIKQNNYLHYVTGIVFDKNKPSDLEILTELNKYTDNIKLLNVFKFLYEYETQDGRLLTVPNDELAFDYFQKIQKEEKVEEMLEQLGRISKIIDQRIDKLSA